MGGCFGKGKAAAVKSSKKSGKTKSAKMPTPPEPTPTPAKELPKSPNIPKPAQVPTPKEHQKEVKDASEPKQPSSSMEESSSALESNESTEEDQATAKTELPAPATEPPNPKKVAPTTKSAVAKPSAPAATSYTCKTMADVTVPAEALGDMKHTSVREFRILVPLSAAEFEKAQIHAVNEGSKQVTGSGNGVEFVALEEFGVATPNNPGKGGLPGNSGIFTKKIYHLQPFIPRVIRALLSDELMTMKEDAWNAYPLCKTLVTNRKWAASDLEVRILSAHVDGDDGRLPNALRLPPEALAVREIVRVDITDDALIGAKNYRAEEDPKKCHTKDGRGPWLPGWERTETRKTCVYKVVIFRLRWRLVETKIRNWGVGAYPAIFAKFHRLAVCTYDEWSPRDIARLRREEKEALLQLNKLRASNTFNGPTAD